MSKKPELTGKEKVSQEIEDITAKHDMIHKPIREVVSTGTFGVDTLTDLPGIPRGVMIDLFGEEHLGKTTFALSMMGERCMRGEHCVYMDIEHRLNRKLVDIVVPINRDLVSFAEPKHGEAAMKELFDLCHKPEVKMVVMDSVAALFTEDRLDPNNENNAQAKVARMLAENLKVLGTLAYENDTIIVFINQMRGRPMQMGPSRAPTGGNTLKFHASIRWEIQRDQPIRVRDNIVGQQVKIKSIKNSYGAPGLDTPLHIVFGEGVDKIRDFIDLGIKYEIIEEVSSWYKYKDFKCNGKDALVREVINVLPALAKDIKAAWTADKAKREEEHQRKIKAQADAMRAIMDAEAECQPVKAESTNI
jgi:recombination protein RecA